MLEWAQKGHRLFMIVGVVDDGVVMEAGRLMLGMF